MKILKNLGILLLFLVALLLFVSFFLPGEVYIERSKTLQAPAEAVFEQINTTRNWQQWSPWMKKEPDMMVTFFGPEAGAGAGFAWDSRESGQGELLILGSAPHSEISYQVDFGRQAFAVGRFEITENRDETRVTWNMKTELGVNPVSRYYGLFLDIIIGSDFESGLRNLDLLLTDRG